MLQIIYGPRAILISPVIEMHTGSEVNTHPLVNTCKQGPCVELSKRGPGHTPTQRGPQLIRHFVEYKNTRQTKYHLTGVEYRVYHK